jgi:hypothetical protein
MRPRWRGRSGSSTDGALRLDDDGHCLYARSVVAVARSLIALSLFGCEARASGGAPGQSMPDHPASASASPASSVQGGAVPAAEDPRARPYRARGPEAAADNERCVRCHEEEARAWSVSHHGRAFDNPAFVRALEVEPSAFCRGCHAPEADPAAPPDAATAALGVGCVTCHVVGGEAVLAASRDGRDWTDDAGAAPHAVRYSTDFAHTGACASCHEFRFPELSGDQDAHFMQTTIREHARSPAAGQSCASCHMPVRAGRRSHAFAEVRDEAWLREQIEITSRLHVEGVLVVTLRQPAPGHAFPTGDLFRRLEVGAELVGARGEVIAREVRYLGRHFEVRPGVRGRGLVRDDRVFDEAVEVELGLARDPSALAAGTEVRWWVDYQRVAQAFDGSDPARAEIESEVSLARGTLPFDTRRP